MFTLTDTFCQKLIINLILFKMTPSQHIYPKYFEAKKISICVRAQLLKYIFFVMMIKIFKILFRT